MVTVVAYRTTVLMAVFCLISSLHALDLSSETDRENGSLEQMSESYEVNRQGINYMAPDPRLGDSAVEETTPAVCPENAVCAFQPYELNDDWLPEPVGELLKLCSCEEGLACVRIGYHRRRRMYYYRCRSTTTVTTPQSERTTQPTRTLSDLTSEITESTLSSIVESIHDSSSEIGTSSILSENSKSARSSSELQRRLGDIKERVEL